MQKPTRERDLQYAKQSIDDYFGSSRWTNGHTALLRALRTLIEQARGQPPFRINLLRSDWKAAVPTLRELFPQLQFGDEPPFDPKQWLAQLKVALRSKERRDVPDADVLRYMEQAAQAIADDVFNSAPALVRLSLEQLRGGTLPSGTATKLAQLDPKALAVVLGQPAASGATNQVRRTMLILPCSVDGVALVPSTERLACLMVQTFLDPYQQPRWPVIDFDDLMREAERFADLSEQADASAGWSKYAATVEQTWKDLTGGAWNETGWLNASGLLVDLIDVGPEDRSLAKEYKALRYGADLRSRAIKAVLSAPKSAEKITPAQAPMSSLAGHMDAAGVDGTRRAFSLDPSQRLAATTMLRAMRDDGPSVLPVNGPPGTGKTAFLRAVLASVWVEDALAERPHPRRVLATGFTNKSVTNVIEAFGAISGDRPGEFTTRWLPGLISYGWFMPSRKMLQQPKESGSQIDLSRFMVLREDNDAPLSDLISRHMPDCGAQIFATALRGDLAKLQQHYIKHARLALGADVAWTVNSVVRALHAKLQNAAHTLEQDRQTLRNLFIELAEIAERRREVATGREQIQQAYDLARRRRARTARLRAAVEAAALWRQTAPSPTPTTMMQRLRALFARWTDGDDGPQRAHRHAAATEALLRRLGRLSPADTAPADSPLADRVAHLHSVYRAALADGLAEGPAAPAVQLHGLRKQRGRVVEDLRRLVGQEGREGASSQWWIDASRLCRKALRGSLAPDAAKQAIEAWLDLQHRSMSFHLAARYWEGRWLLHAMAPKEGKPCALPPMAAWSMLSVVIVATASRLRYVMESIAPPVDLLIVDEAGQCSVLDGLWLLGSTKHALIVGDIHQLEPVYPLPRSHSHRLMRAAGLDPEQTPPPFDVSRGSLMQAAHLGASVMEPDADALEGQRGVMLRTHYRCAPAIAGYCNDLRYAGAMRMARPVEDPQQARVLQRMTWVDVRGEPKQQLGSWRNEQEVEEVLRWLRHEGHALEEKYGKPLDEVVAVVAPLRGQADALSQAVQARLTDCFDAAVLQRMVVGTVHRLQGAERPVVAMSLTQTTSPLFADTREGRLMNVAVSRAQDQFIVFGDRRLLGAAPGDKPGADPGGAVAQLGRYMQVWGARRYPRKLVLIEAPGKRTRIESALGLDVAAVATGGNIDQLESIGPRGELNFSPPTKEWLQEANRYADLEELVVATDDDLAGELIGWRAATTLQSLPGRHLEHISRMRFHSTEPEDLRLAMQTRGDRFDAKLLSAALLRAVLRLREHKRLLALGVPWSLTQLAVLELASKRPVAPAIVTLEAPSGEQVQAFIAAGPGALSAPADEAPPVLIGASVGNWNDAGTIGQQLEPYPANTTARVLALAADELGMLPWDTQAHLNALYQEGARGHG